MWTAPRWILVLVGVGTLSLGGDLQAQADKPLDRKEMDQRVYEVLRDVINTGADLFNPPSSDRAGCYRLYQGSLTTLRPLLDHRPELQKAIDAGLVAAQQETNAAARAFALRRVIDKIRADVRVEAVKPPATALWDQLGGEKGVTKVVDDLVALAASDKAVNFFRDGKYNPDADQVSSLKRKLVEMISEASGGPLKYSGKSMKEAHKGMGITNAEFDALAANLKTVLEKNGVKAEDAAAVLKAVDGTRKDIVEPKASDKEKSSSLWERLGGEKAVTKVVDDFVDLAVNNPKADLTRGGKYKPDAAAIAEMKKRLVEMVSEAAGGPHKYQGKDMKTVHKGMNIADAEFDALANDLKTALDKNGVKAESRDELLKIVETTRKHIVEKKE